MNTFICVIRSKWLTSNGRLPVQPIMVHDSDVIFRLTLRQEAFRPENAVGLLLEKAALESAGALLPNPNPSRRPSVFTLTSEGEGDFERQRHGERFVRADEQVLYAIGGREWLCAVEGAGLGFHFK